MIRVTDDRAGWLAQHVLPHESNLRNWLKAKRFRGIDLDDVVQETYAILAGLESVEGIRNVRNYMFSVAASVIKHQLRRSRIVQIGALADMDSLLIANDRPAPDTEVEDRQELQRLAEAIPHLPDRCRQVFMLRKIDGLPQRDVALKLGVSEGTVEKQLARSINILMRVLGRGGKPPSGASMSGKQDRVGLGTHRQKGVGSRD
jgi:RNA polymerase sigma-70 factor (ECF subfamily)